MSEKVNKEFPYKTLGSLLRRIREKKQESLAEVSGAVEIDAEQLTNIETGRQRPSEDILSLLISYFSIADQDADKLWDLAGYDRTRFAGDAAVDGGQHQQVMVMPMDARVIYTDMVHVAANKYGVIMNFMQNMGLNGKPLAVARLGMSQEHALRLLELLQKALLPSEPKLLPAPKDPESSSDA